MEAVLHLALPPYRLIVAGLSSLHLSLIHILLDYLYDDLDLILLMTVNPGFGGQQYIPAMTEKIRVLRERIDDTEKPILLQVDGGIDETTAPIVAGAGADLLVAGSAVFGHDDPADQIERLLGAARLGTGQKA